MCVTLRGWDSVAYVTHGWLHCRSRKSYTVSVSSSLPRGSFVAVQFRGANTMSDVSPALPPVASTESTLSTSTIPVTSCPSPAKMPPVAIFPGFSSTPLVAAGHPGDAPPLGSAASSAGAGGRPAPPPRDTLAGLTRCFNPPKLERWALLQWTF